MKAVLVCIAKDEDNYIDEWLLYHFKLGFSEAYVVQNDWRYAGTLAGDRRVHLLEEPARGMQRQVYHDRMRDLHGTDIDFAAFFDVDEFMCLKPGLTLDEFLSRFTDCVGVMLNWKLFGDSGLYAPDGDYSLVRRFTRCQHGLFPVGKTIVNLRRVDPDSGWQSPHNLDQARLSDCVKSADGSTFARGPAVNLPPPCQDKCPAWLNHYFCKTRQEFVGLKIPRGRADVLTDRTADYWRRWKMFNRNETDDFTARDFYFGTGEVSLDESKRADSAMCAKARAVVEAIDNAGADTASGG